MRAPRPQETTPLNARAKLERSEKKRKEVPRHIRLAEYKTTPPTSRVTGHPQFHDSRHIWPDMRLAYDRTAHTTPKLMMCGRVASAEQKVAGRGGGGQHRHRLFSAVAIVQLFFSRI